MYRISLVTDLSALSRCRTNVGGGSRLIRFPLRFPVAGTEREDVFNEIVSGLRRVARQSNLHRRISARIGDRFEERRTFAESNFEGSAQFEVAPFPRSVPRRWPNVFGKQVHRTQRNSTLKPKDSHRLACAISRDFLEYNSLPRQE